MKKFFRKIIKITVMFGIFFMNLLLKVRATNDATNTYDELRTAFSSTDTSYGATPAASNIKIMLIQMLLPIPFIIGLITYLASKASKKKKIIASLIVIIIVIAIGIACKPFFKKI